MRIAPLPLSALPLWCRSNNVEFLDTTVRSSEICLHGDNASPQNGISTTRALTTVNTCDIPTVLDIPSDLILGKDFLLEIEKVDHHFKQLRELVGERSIRLDIMLFLLLQITIARNDTTAICTSCYQQQLDCYGFEETESGNCHNCDGSEQECILSTAVPQPDRASNVGVRNPWSDYVRFLPQKVPLPTMWNDEERMLLTGTSLEDSVISKMVVLSREFGDLREKTIQIPWCHSCWWEDGGPFQPLLLSDWVRLDALYRSRSLVLGNAGDVMVPVLDMANHSFQHTAFWRQASNGNAVLVLEQGIQLDAGSEVTINYGARSDAENLFNYGFIDEKIPFASLVLGVEPMGTDPLRTAKVAAFQKRPSIRIIGHSDGQTSWECPFLYLACLNEEDGLEFKTVQQVDGEQSLEVFWQGTDVTESVDQFETLISGHRLEDVFKLRATELVRDRVEVQLERLLESRQITESLRDEMIDRDTRRNASELKRIESVVLEAVYGSLIEEISELSKIVHVTQLLQSVHVDSDDLGPESNEEDDFS
ncbi:697b3389-712a-416d-8197-86d2031d49ae [Sclerotinia trifoliorum]|uniref:697b3389-712a-416d-8197-86d2031d49ae n=1 Tax=Sclerotinia trifoliorum TaxID=28548 RepID=A0A8H2VQD7_9HELO|nr:697b3389-712a-416d-8197-86d2031d49ae [Sclerotinia trifoliorum]